MQANHQTIGLTTFNRKDILLKCLIFFNHLNPRHDFIVCDDASTEYDEKILKSNISNWKIYRANTNSGRADFAMARLMDLFLELGRDYLLILDSDLIVDPELSDFMVTNAQNTDGIFSIFNAPLHQSIGEDGFWIYKNHIGAAGTVLSREIVQEIRQNVPMSNQYDWDWSSYIVKSGRSIRVSK